MFVRRTIEKRNINWIVPEKTINSGESAFVDDCFAHEDYYERTIVDSSYLGVMNYVDK